VRRPRGSDFTAMVKRKGQQIHVIVNPDTIQITREG
jgi:SepF-like predicted cell division protein (DUF552 family)